MRKVLLIVLVVVAVPLYVWNAWLLLRGLSGTASEKRAGDVPAVEQLDVGFLLRTARVVRFVDKGRSPFLAYPERPKLKPVRRPQVAKVVPKEEEKPPDITISGIMWNPTNPVAMVNLPGGASAVAKAGGSLPGGIEVLKVEKNGIRVKHNGRTHWIGK